MKILNEKGKLFGIINIVDLFIIIFLVVAGGFVYSYFNTITKENPNALTNKTYNVVLEVQWVDEEVCNAMKEDKTVFDRVENKSFGKLLKVECSPMEEWSVSQIDGSMKKVTIPDYYKAELTMEIVTDENMYIGKQLSIATKDFTARGNIIGIE